METPYIKHIFGSEVDNKLASQLGWLTTGVASSISWPSADVCIQYLGDDYFLRGSERAGERSPPGITIACDQADIDKALAKVYRFTSVLSWFMGGFVDVSGYIWGNRPSLYGNPRTVFSTLGIAGEKTFNCNHMPLIDSENIRKALAFWREGQRLYDVHPSYSFLSFYKVIESQFLDPRKRVEWVKVNLDKLTNQAAKRVFELRSAGVDVNNHLYQSGRCAIAHASVDGTIVDPDNPSDKRRLNDDLIVIKELARIYIDEELNVPTSRSLYQSRNRLAPWAQMLSIDLLDTSSKGKQVTEISGFKGQEVSVGLWPDGAISGLERMRVNCESSSQAMIKLELINDSKTILLIFYLDYKNGRVHTALKESGLVFNETKPSKADAEAFATFFYKVLGNGIAELTINDFEPIDCEVVIPVNIIPPNPEIAIRDFVARFE